MKLNVKQYKMLSRLIAYQDRYDISVQFWPGQTTVFIAKDGVDLESWGGEFDFAVMKAVEYLDRINKKK